MRSGRRPAPRTAAFLALALLAAACSGPGTPSRYGRDGDLPTGRASRPGRDTRARHPTDAPPPAGSPSPVGEPGGDPYADRGPVGAMARAYLRPGPARRLVVEIDHVRGRRPSGGTVAHLGAVLERELDKPVAVRVDDEIPPTGGRHSVADLAGLEERYRSAHSRGDEAAMWLVWLDGALEEDPSSLGVAYRASAAAIFRDRIDSAATVLVPASAIERSVAVHEAGHLLALVHIGYSIPHEHEDPDHPRHSRFRDSVMYWAIEDISIASILRGGPPDDFDAVDRDDLRELRTGTA